MKLGLNWGANAEERAAPLPCDELAPTARTRANRAIGIQAPPATVFAWLCQLRIAPYSYDLLDNWGRRSPREREPDMTDLHIGQRFMTMFTLASFVTDQHITLRAPRVAVTYAVRPDGAGTRLHARVRFAGPRPVGWALALGDLVMMRKQLLVLKSLAECEDLRARSSPP